MPPSGTALLFAPELHQPSLLNRAQLAREACRAPVRALRTSPRHPLQAIIDCRSGLRRMPAYLSHFRLASCVSATPVFQRRRSVVEGCSHRTEHGRQRNWLGSYRGGPWVSSQAASQASALEQHPTVIKHRRIIRRSVRKCCEEAKQRVCLLSVQPRWQASCHQ